MKRPKKSPHVVAFFAAVVAVACAERATSPIEPERQVSLATGSASTLDNIACTGGQFHANEAQVFVPVGAKDTIAANDLNNANVWWGPSDNDTLIFSVRELASGAPATAEVTIDPDVVSPDTGCLVIHANTGSNKGYVQIIVIPRAVSRVEVTPSSKLMLIGGTAQLTATAYEQQQNVFPGVTFSWQSLNTGVATVSGSGVVTAVAEGTALVVASASGKADTTTVTVKVGSPTTSGSLTYDPEYPTGRATLSWASVTGAISYQIYRKCKMSNGYSPGWELWETTSGTTFESFDYVLSHNGTSEPSSEYFAYYVVAIGSTGPGGSSETRYFAFDEDAEPGC